MSLTELIETLEQVKREHPELLDKPIWTSNIPPLSLPLKTVKISGHGTMLHFEGGA